MISLLKGTVFTIKQNPITLLVGGVGYGVNVPSLFMGKKTKGDEVLLYIHSYVREDAFDLFGFETEDELELFRLLITVSGIGPKTALIVMNHGVDAIQQAIKNADVDFFTAIPRLGKKNAQKIIIELKNKIGGLHDISLHESLSGQTQDLVSALTSMGFVKKEIIQCIRQIPKEENTLEKQIRYALRILGS